MSTLKDCPFCGSEDIKIKFRERGMVVFCVGCGVQTPDTPDNNTVCKAITHWNKRYLAGDSDKRKNYIENDMP